MLVEQLANRRQTVNDAGLVVCEHDRDDRQTVVRDRTELLEIELADPVDGDDRAAQMFYGIQHGVMLDR